MLLMFSWWLVCLVCLVLFGLILLVFCLGLVWYSWLIACVRCFVWICGFMFVADFYRFWFTCWGRLYVVQWMLCVLASCLFLVRL